MPAKEARKVIQPLVVEHKGRGLALRSSGCSPLKGLRLVCGCHRLKWGSVEPRAESSRRVGGLGASGRRSDRHLALVSEIRRRPALPKEGTWRNVTYGRRTI